MDIKNIDWGNILDGLSTVATVFNPSIGSSLIVASKVADRLQGVDDDFLENNVIGLTRSSEILDDMIEKNEVDFEVLKMLSENLKSLDVIVNKTSKILR